MKKYYVYIQGQGIVEETFPHKEVSMDILVTLVNKYGARFKSFSSDYYGAARMYLDEIFYDTYKI